MPQCRRFFVTILNRHSSWPNTALNLTRYIGASRLEKRKGSRSLLFLRREIMTSTVKSMSSVPCS